MFDIRIYTFLAVCQSMNYTKAAQSLNITQPAVSQHIHYLEEHYETKLFEYEGRKLTLTENGRLLLKMATTFTIDEEFYRDFVKHKTERTMPMFIGLTQTIGEFVITKSLAKLIKNHDKADMRFMIKNTEQLLEDLLSGKIHFALIEGYYNENEFDHINYSEERFVAICAAKHHLPEHCETMRDLASETLILREPGSGTRNIMEKNLDLNNMKVSDFRRRVEFNNMHGIIELVKDDCGITFLYEAAVKEYIDRGEIRIIELKDFNMQHQFTFVWNKGSMYSKVYTAVCNELMQI